MTYVVKLGREGGYESFYILIIKATTDITTYLYLQ